MPPLIPAAADPCWAATTARSAAALTAKDDAVREQGTRQVRIATNRKQGKIQRFDHNLPENPQKRYFGLLHRACGYRSQSSHSLTSLTKAVKPTPISTLARLAQDSPRPPSGTAVSPHESSTNSPSHDRASSLASPRGTSTTVSVSTASAGREREKMSQLLTSRQADELHKSMIAYLLSIGMTDTASSLRQEARLTENDGFDDATAKKYETLLEKKWTSVVRLQKKIIDLEAKCKGLQDEIDSATPLSSNRKLDPLTWSPKSPPKQVFEGHKFPVNAVAFHPVFSELASCSEDSTIRIWDYELGESLHTLKGHTRAVLDIDYGGPRGGTLLASCSSDLTIKLWDPSDNYKNIRTLPGHDHSISSVRFIPSGAAGAPLSGNLLVSASRDQTLRIWDVTTGYCLKTLRGHTEWVRAVTPSLDGRFLLSAGNDRIPRLWDANTGEVKITFEGHDHYLETVAFAPPSAYKHISELAGYKRPPPPSSSGEFLATAGRDKVIKLWDNRGTCHKTLVGHDNWIKAIVFHPGGRYLLSVSEDKTIRCWDLTQEAKCVKVITDAHEHFVTDIRWAPDMSSAAQVNGDSPSTNGASASKDTTAPKIRCVIATSSVDLKVRVFAG